MISGEERTSLIGIHSKILWIVEYSFKISILMIWHCIRNHIACAAAAAARSRARRSEIPTVAQSTPPRRTTKSTTTLPPPLSASSSSTTTPQPSSTTALPCRAGGGRWLPKATRAAVGPQPCCSISFSSLHAAAKLESSQDPYNQDPCITSANAIAHNSTIHFHTAHRSHHDTRRMPQAD